MKKKTLLTSLLTIAMCLALIAGSTYALFTSEDKVDISVNSGKVNVTATVTNLVTYSMGEVTEVKGEFANGGTALFTSNDVKLLKLDRVTPGDKVTFTIELTNASTVDVQYRLIWNITGALSEALEINATNLDWTKWTTAEATTKTIDVTVELPTNFETQGLADAAISFKVEAVQANAIVKDVATADQLWAALEMGVANITVTQDITLAKGQVITVAEGATTEINLNGKTITGSAAKANGAVLTNNGTLVLTGGTIKNTVTNGASAIQNNGTLTLDGVTVVGAASDTSVGSADYAINTTGATASLTIVNDSNISGRGAIGVTNGSKLVINGGTYHTPEIAWGHAIYADGEGTQVTINSGTFSEGYEMAADNWGMYQIYAGNNAKVIVNGGTFMEWDCANGYDLCTANGGVIEIYGGTFAEDPSAQGGKNYVAEYFQAVESNGTWSVIPEEGVEVVKNATQLTTALTDAAAAGAGDSTVYLMGNIDLTDTTWTPISVDGYHGAGIVTVEGNGATITGLTAPLFAGGFAGKSGIVIKNLTIADSNIVSNSGLGGGAFIDTADSMQVITLENCHLVNSTVTGERTGGLLGWCSGYAELDDGPVKTYVTIADCSVIDCEIIGAGSAAGIAGHPGASDYTYTTIENCLVKDTTVHSNDDGGWRVGAIVGTANNGHVVINNCTVEDVELSQINKTAPAGQSNLFGRFVPSGTGTLVIDGANYVADTTTLKNLLSSDAEEIEIVLATNISIDIGTGWNMGGANTTSISICGITPETTLTLSSTYRSYFNLANTNGTLYLKNLVLTNTHKGTHFFDYTTHFNCNVVAENVNFAKAPLIEAKAELINCEFNQPSVDGYGLWIMSGADVTVTGGVVNSERGIKITDEDSAAATTNLAVSGTKFNNTEKAAILATTKYGATIDVKDVDISACTADNKNAVWIDEDRTEYADKIIVTGGATCVPET